MAMILFGQKSEGQRAHRANSRHGKYANDPIQVQWDHKCPKEMDHTNLVPTLTHFHKYHKDRIDWVPLGPPLDVPNHQNLQNTKHSF